MAEALTGQALAVILAGRFPQHDWLDALARMTHLPRGEIERHLQERYPLPPAIAAAAERLDATRMAPGPPPGGTPPD
jgi:hypothetical protein